MLHDTEVSRLAEMAHALRPDWPIRSLCTWLTRSHHNRAYRDVAVALAWIACDPATQTPKRMDEQGPWWAAVKLAGSDSTPLHYARCPEPGHGSYPAHNCGACRAEQLAAEDRAAQEIAALSPEQLDVNARGARRARAAIKRKEEA